MQIADIDFCTQDDLDEICSIETACFSAPVDRRVIEGDLRNLGEIVYVKALLRCAIAGYGVLGRSESVAHLLNLAVLPEFRRMGVAWQLALALGEIADAWGCGRIRLEVRSSNSGAREFYAKLGFAYMSRTRGYYSNGEDAIILVARLPLSTTS
jgi:ribosomal-protein-alanine N-acetyltransferase